MQRVIALAALGLSGCVAVPVVEQASDEQPIKTSQISCTAPYALTQDCDPSWLGARILNVDGVEAAVAATADGEIVLVMDAHPIRNMLLSNPYVLNSPRHSRATNSAHDAVRMALEKNGVQIVRSIPLKTFSDTSGYAVHLDGDGYEILRKYTVRMRD